MRYFTDDVLTLGFIDQYDAASYFTGKFREVTGDDLDRFLNPENYLSDEEKVFLTRKRMPNLTPIEFKWKLVNSGLYQQVEDFMSSTDNLLLKIAYQNAIFFNRTDPILTQAMQALGLTDEQVDEIWLS